MKIISLLLSLCLASVALAEEPAELTELRQTWEKERAEAQAKVDKLYFEELEQLKENFTKAGNIEAARAVDNTIKEGEKADNEPQALTKMRGFRRKSLQVALKSTDKKYWQELKKLRGGFQKQGSLGGIDAADAEIKKVLAAYKNDAKANKSKAANKILLGELGNKVPRNPFFIECKPTGIVIYDRDVPIKAISIKEIPTSAVFNGYLLKVGGTNDSHVYFLVRKSGKLAYDWAAGITETRYKVKHTKLPLLNDGPIDLTAHFK